MANISAFQLYVLRIYDNLSSQSAQYDPAIDGDVNYAENLLSGFLSNGSFMEALQASAREVRRDDIVRDVPLVVRADIQSQSTADYLISELQKSNLAPLADMAKPPAIPSLSTLDSVWGFIDAVEKLDNGVYEVVLTSPEYAAAVERASNLGTIPNYDEFAAGEIANAKAAFPGLIPPEIQAKANAFIEGFKFYTGEHTAAPFTPQFTIDTPTAPSTEPSNTVLPSLTEMGAFGRAVQSLPAAPNADAAPTVDLTTPEAPVTTTTGDTNFSWNDDKILSTYNQLLRLNPESVTSATSETQEAYSFAQRVLELTIQVEQRIDDPAAWERNGNLPVGWDTVEVAENNAYGYLSSLSPEDGQALSTEVSQIVTSDTELGLTPLSPEIIAGQQYLESIGLNEQGTAFLETPPVEHSDPQVIVPQVDTPPAMSEHLILASLGESEAPSSALPQIDTAPPSTVTEEAVIVDGVANTNTEPTALSFGDGVPTTNGGITAASQNLSFDNLAVGSSLDSMIMDFHAAQPLLTSANVDAAPTARFEEDPYLVQSGDNLWNIARQEYGLTSATDIMRAVDHIANANGLENGVDANHITPYDPNEPESGQLGTGILKMPTAETISMNVSDMGYDKLDWAALDADSTIGHRPAALSM